MPIADSPVDDAAVSDRREALLIAAVYVIARRGIDGARYQDVAEEAGVSIGTLQHHFGTRRAMIVEAIARSVAIGSGLAIDRFNDFTDPWERLQAIVNWATDGLEGREDEWKVWLEGLAAATRDPEIEQAVVAAYATWQGPVTQAIVDGAASGRFRPVVEPDEAAAIILAAVDGIALQVLATRVDEGAEAGRRRLSALADALLRPTT